jgi:hypothetical protein
MSELVERLAAELERPREVTRQVANYIVRTYGVEDDAIGDFFVQKLPQLEDDETDLTLSPLFTPKLRDQAAFADFLGSAGIAREEWPALVQQLEARPTRAQFITSDGRQHAVMLRAVTIERYLYRLRLDGAITASVLALLRGTPAADQPLLKAVARRPIWENDGRRDILITYLENAVQRDSFRIQDAVDLLNLVESYKPATLPELNSSIPRWVESLRHELRTSATKPFFNPKAQEMHGGDRNQRQQDQVRLSAKENELAFLERLAEILGTTR